MSISTTKMRILILDSLPETSDRNPMPCCKLAKKIALKERIINDEYISYAFLSADFRDTFQNVLQNLNEQKIVQLIPSDGPEPWSGYVYLQ